MSRARYEELFACATDGASPYPWQRALALRERPARVVGAPTGAGKTEAVLLDWVWRRLVHPDSEERRRTPRRLVFALPMRVLVEQTLGRMNTALSRLHESGHTETAIKAYPLMGGAADDSWTRHPEQPAVLVGTIDMLLSRALNRGFGRARSQWPIDFGLLNSDCLWVFDEIQLMDAAVATSCQLQALRERFLVAAPSRTLWMSATLDLSWLETVDHAKPGDNEFALVGPDDNVGVLGRRLAAPKRLVRAEVDPGDAKAVAQCVLEEHRALTGVPDAPRLTLALTNTVDRAVKIYDALKEELRGGRPIDCILLHSRFRPVDRMRLVQRLEAPVTGEGRIIVSTQVVEAGIDLDAGALVTELAPWPSLVQRAGRLNRTGQRSSSPSRFVWLDAPSGSLRKLAPPYELEQLERSRRSLLELDGESFSPNAITEYTRTTTSSSLLGERPLTLFLRAPDLIDLFETSATLDGDDPDVGRFIRSSQDLDVGVAWRDFSGDPNESEQPLPERNEVCPVPVWEREALAGLVPWRWSYARRRWEKIASASDLVPGDLLIVAESSGGYSDELGWTGRTRETVGTLEPAPVGLGDSDADDGESVAPGRWITLAEHTAHVVEELEQILDGLDLEGEWVDALRLAARVHDVGKAHREFQQRLERWAGESRPDTNSLYAKAPERHRWRPPRAFRHELVSALLLLERDRHSRDRDLAAYLVGAHHGKFRLVPRLLPDDHDPNRAVCLGVRDGDDVPEVIVEGERFGPAALDLTLLHLGDSEQATWIERALDLLDTLGPFRLAYLEAVLRAADQRASAREGEAPR